VCTQASHGGLPTDARGGGGDSHSTAGQITPPSPSLLLLLPTDAGVVVIHTAQQGRGSPPPLLLLLLLLDWMLWHNVHTKHRSRTSFALKLLLSWSVRTIDRRLSRLAAAALRTCTQHTLRHTCRRGPCQPAC
jgi:hypothetical protein